MQKKMATVMAPPLIGLFCWPMDASRSLPLAKYPTKATKTADKLCPPLQRIMCISKHPQSKMSDNIWERKRDNTGLFYNCVTLLILVHSSRECAFLQPSKTLLIENYCVYIFFQTALYIFVYKRFARCACEWRVAALVRCVKHVPWPESCC